MFKNGKYTFYLWLCRGKPKNTLRICQRYREEEAQNVPTNYNIPGEKQDARLAGSALATAGAVLAPKPLEDREDIRTKVNVMET